MFKKIKKESDAMTIEDLKKTILQYKVVPTPDYSKCKPYKMKIDSVPDYQKAKDDDMER